MAGRTSSGPIVARRVAARSGARVAGGVRGLLGGPVDTLSELVIAALFVVGAVTGWLLWVEWGGWAYAWLGVIATCTVPVVVLRRRFPRACLLLGYGLLALLALLALITQVGLGAPIMMAAAPVLLATVTRWCARWWGRGALLAGLVGAAASPLVLAAVGHRLATYLVHALVLVVVWVWALRRRDQDTQRAAELCRVVVESEERSRLAERSRIAAEVHDVVAHNLMVVQVQASTALALADPDRQYAALDTVRTVSGRALTEIRDLVAALHTSSTPERPCGTDAVALVRQTLAEVGSAGVRIVDRLPPDEEFVRAAKRWPASTGLAVHRILQESLTNVVKHGGPAPRAEVALCDRDDVVSVSVRSRGRRREGTPPPAPGWGLVGLRERVAVHGGRLLAAPTADGFEVVATLPYRPVSSEAAR